ncbi:hypothetical protein BDR07DRAFT_265855 [Suillus spraguei]|nr:hypothetical protein BDR07DRAFT_967538 [Suillus spraguei]KAG2358600.1 hypothetical protein BDR07DRAFT_265855 [Suillus spraguei]
MYVSFLSLTTTMIRNYLIIASITITCCSLIHTHAYDYSYCTCTLQLMHPSLSFFFVTSLVLSL